MISRSAKPQSGRKIEAIVQGQLLLAGLIGLTLSQFLPQMELYFFALAGRGRNYRDGLIASSMRNGTREVVGIMEA